MSKKKAEEKECPHCGCDCNVCGQSQYTEKEILAFAEFCKTQLLFEPHRSSTSLLEQFKQTLK